MCYKNEDNYMLFCENNNKIVLQYYNIYGMYVHTHRV